MVDGIFQCFQFFNQLAVMMGGPVVVLDLEINRIFFEGRNAFRADIPVQRFQGCGLIKGQCQIKQFGGRRVNIKRNIVQLSGKEPPGYFLCEGL